MAPWLTDDCVTLGDTWRSSACMRAWVGGASSDSLTVHVNNMHVYRYVLLHQRTWLP